MPAPAPELPELSEDVLRLPPASKAKRVEEIANALARAWSTRGGILGGERVWSAYIKDDHGWPRAEVEAAEDAMREKGLTIECAWTNLTAEDFQRFSIRVMTTEEKNKILESMHVIREAVKLAGPLTHEGCSFEVTLIPHSIDVVRRAARRLEQEGLNVEVEERNGSPCMIHVTTSSGWESGGTGEDW